MGKRIKKKISPASIQGITSNVSDLTSAGVTKAIAKAGLDGSRFRWLNESLYTEPSASSYDQFQNNPELFRVYHTGFRSQCENWPTNPVDEICNYIRKYLPKGSVIADFGCGDAKIAQTFQSEYTVHSYDLVSVNPLVTACNIANVPLDSSSADLVIFSLSLMGTDWPNFVKEAQRCLKYGGIMYIAEVQSRLLNPAGFPQHFSPSFKVLRYDNKKEKYFVTLILKKDAKTGSVALDSKLLKPCQYKKR